MEKGRDGRTTRASATRGVSSQARESGKEALKERTSNSLWSISSYEETKENAKEYPMVEEGAPRKEKFGRSIPQGRIQTWLKKVEMSPLNSREVCLVAWTRNGESLD